MTVMSFALILQCRAEFSATAHVYRTRVPTVLVRTHICCAITKTVHHEAVHCAAVPQS